ncbi:MAG: entericidin A/B family lipoprotein [Gammaproteobacteria bacterium]|nr:entericidin A/B family lipoprotein [Gammaproteobacteria bacterium]
MRNVIIAVACFLCVSVGLLSGCNTVHGVGKDVSNSGEAIERAVR